MRKLGRGLSELGLNELLGNSHANPSAAAVDTLGQDKLQYLLIDNIFPGQSQPRKHMDQAALAELADSIRAQGIIQPIIVRARPNNRYEIIAGERRWRAAQLAQLDKIPAIVRDVSDQTAVAFALIENIQRRDLNAMEEAQALQRLLQEFNLTHQEVAAAVGKSRVTISNLLRLLQLNADVKMFLAEGQIEMGHARALLAIEGNVQSDLAQQVIANGLSVRQTEALVRQQQNPAPATAAAPISQPDANTLQWQQTLSEKLGAKVSIRHNPQGKGKLVINYHSLAELTGILAHIN